MERTQAGLLPQAASTRAENALESSRLAGNDQGPEDGEPASGSASEEAESDESEEEELLLHLRFLECLDFFPFFFFFCFLWPSSRSPRDSGGPESLGPNPIAEGSGLPDRAAEELPLPSISLSWSSDRPEGTPLSTRDYPPGLPGPGALRTPLPHQPRTARPPAPVARPL